MSGLRRRGRKATFSDRILKERSVAEAPFLIGLAPGATTGPAKRWHPERFASVADRLIERFWRGSFFFGSSGDHEVARARPGKGRKYAHRSDRRTTLREAISLIAPMPLFVTNGLGPDARGGGLGFRPSAIFGSTNPRTTSPVGQRSR